MKNTLFVSIITLVLGFSSFAQKEQIKLITSDIDNFWNAYDAIHQTTDSIERIKIIHDRYINRASAGLKGMILARDYKDFEFVNAILNYPKYWNSIRSNSDFLVKDIKQIEDNFTKLKDLYPELQSTTIYFPIGVFRSPGTYQGRNVLMGAEFMLAHQKADFSELPERVQKGMKEFIPYDIPLIALHELIHTQQKPWEQLSIVHKSVAEGVAEFIATLISEKPLGYGIVFGKKNEKKVLDQYMIEIFRDNDIGNWLWSTNENELKVNDLGYYIGYEICERYYNKATNKSQAIKELIELNYSNNKEFAKILDGAGFLPLTWKEIGEKYESMRPKVVGIQEFKNGSKKVSITTKTITFEFSEPMHNCCRSFDYDESKKGALLKIKKFIGWSEDMKKFTIEIDDLQPNTSYHLIISNFAKEDGGNRLAPYTIEFTTANR